MVPGIGLRMIQTLAVGDDPWEQAHQRLYTLTAGTDSAVVDRDADPIASLPTAS